MYYEVYLDQFFLENLVMTVFLQKICGKLMNRSLSWKRIWLASLTGTAASCAVIFFSAFQRLAGPGALAAFAGGAYCGAGMQAGKRKRHLPVHAVSAGGRGLFRRHIPAGFPGVGTAGPAGRSGGVYRG